MPREPYGHTKVLMAVMAQGFLGSGNSECKTTSLPFLPRKPYAIAITYLGATAHGPLALMPCRPVRFRTDGISPWSTSATDGFSGVRPRRSSCEGWVALRPPSFLQAGGTAI